MSEQMITYFMYAVAALFAMIVVAYLIISTKSKSKGIQQLQQLRKGTKAKTLSTEVLYQRLYLILIKKNLYVK